MSFVGLSLPGCTVGIIPPGATSTDDQFTVAVRLGPGPIEFSRAREVLVRNNCTRCHGRTLGTYTQESDFIREGWIVAGDPGASKLYQALKGSGYSWPEALRMPQGGDISAKDRELIREWILRINTTSSQACNDAPEVATLKRLSQKQYLNTVRDLFSRAFTQSSDLQYIVQGNDGNPALISFIPADQTEKEFHSFDQTLQSSHVDGYIVAAFTAAQRATGIEQNRAQMISALFSRFATGCTWSSNPSPACVESFIRNFGKTALRRPLEGTISNATSDVGFYYQSFQNLRGQCGPWVAQANCRLRDLIALFLSSPDFIYHHEFRGAPIESNSSILRLSAHELANRLSYQLWQSMPDDHLFTAAEDRSLLTEEGFTAQVSRMISDTKAKDMLDHFVSTWLKLDELPAASLSELPADFISGTRMLVTSRRALNNNNLYQHIRDQAIAEIKELFRYYTWELSSNLPSVLTSDISFADREQLADLYGVNPWIKGDYRENSLVRFPTQTRSGLLTRAGFLFNGGLETRPIMRGVKIRKDILCDTLELPESNNPPTTSPLPIHATKRQRIENITQQPGSACITCHETKINPLGFALEDFDSFGRNRGLEAIWETRAFDWGTSYQYQTGVDLQMSSTVQPNISLDTDTQESTLTGGLELGRAIASSGRAESCFAKKYFRFTYGRIEGQVSEVSEIDRCRAGFLESRLTGPAGSIREMIRSIVDLPSFRLRRHGAP
jgi:hypothetical protein